MFQNHVNVMAMQTLNRLPVMRQIELRDWLQPHFEFVLPPLLNLFSILMPFRICILF